MSIASVLLNLIWPQTIFSQASVIETVGMCVIKTKDANHSHEDISIHGWTVAKFGLLCTISCCAVCI